MIVHVVARQIGERGGGDTHAVKPLLIQTMRGRLDREIRDATRGEPLEKLMQRDRIRRRQRSVDGERARHDADGSDRRRLAPQRLPDLANKGRDRVFPLVPVTATIVSGWRGIEARSSVSQCGAASAT